VNLPHVIGTVNFTRISWVGGLLCLALCGACQTRAIPAPQHAKAPPPQHVEASQHAKASQHAEVPQAAAPQDEAELTPQHGAVANVIAEHAVATATQ
jgi:hypothetical protein